MEFDFGKALELCKGGTEVSRRQWYKKKYLQINKGVFDFKASAEEAGDMGTFLENEKEPKLCSVCGIAPELFTNVETSVTVLPSIQIYDIDSKVIECYTPTQRDMLANDWYVF